MANSDITKWASEDGHFRRQTSTFRDFITPNGDFTPENGRYHLYVSLACPWAHRTLIVRKLKGLEDVIGVTIVSPHMGALGWPFASEEDKFPGAEKDSLHPELKHIRDLYFRVNPDYTGRFTVPVLWDKKNETIVNNESSEIIRILNTAFDGLVDDGEKKGLDLYPDALKAEIDELNAWVYDTVNNGVYKSGFATSQGAYEAAVQPLFASLDRLEVLLAGKDFLVGGTLTEADVRLYTTIVRFDPCYHGHFKCNLGMIRHDYPQINRWLKNLYWKNAAFKDTTDFNHIKTHYYWSHPQINPTRIVPLGPKVNIEPL